MTVFVVTVEILAIIFGVLLYIVFSFWLLAKMNCLPVRAKWSKKDDHDLEIILKRAYRDFEGDGS